MKIVKINNIPSNVGAYVVGNPTKEESDKAGSFSMLVFFSIVLGTVYLNYKYITGKL
jgi:hypothetical protein